MSAQPSHYRLRMVNGPLRGATYYLRDSFVMGRGGACDLALLDRHVSRLHTRIARDDDNGYVVYDLGSKNGTRVNGRLIERATLGPGDELAIGGFRLVFEPVPVVVATAASPPESRSLVRAMAVVNDVVAYRSLAAALARKELIDLATLRRLQDLDAKLRCPDDLEEYLELEAPMPARLSVEDGESKTEGVVMIKSLGVAGATIYAQGLSLPLQAVVHVAPDLSASGSTARIVLSGIVAAVGGGICRVAFSMSAGWAARMSVFQTRTTQAIQTRAIAANVSELQAVIAANESGVHAVVGIDA